MGGLIFNPPGKYQLPEPESAQTRASNLASRGRSTNDLLGLWKESRGALIDDPDSSRPPLVRQGSERLSERLRGGSEQRSLEKTLSSPKQLENCLDSDGSGSNEVTLSNLKPLNNPNYSNPQPQNFASTSSSDWGTGSASFLLKPQYESPMDSATLNGDVLSSEGVKERERGNVSGLVRGDSVSVRSDLSRESSAELEHMLVSKVSLNILLAEDNAINQKVASRQLEKHGHVVTIVGDGQEALDVMCCRHDDFDLVLMDVQVLLPNLPSPLSECFTYRT